MKPVAPLITILAAALALLFAVPLANAETAAATAKPAAATKAKTTEKSDASVEALEAKAAKERDEAAARRAKGSEFESEKLDGGAFADGEAADQQAAKKSGTGASMLRMIFGLLVVLGAIYGVHYLLKKWGQSKLQGIGGGNGELIDVMATTALAPGRTLHLVRVGGEIVLIGATEHSISRIGQVEARPGGIPADGELELPAVTRPALPVGTKSEFHSMLGGAMTGDAVTPTPSLTPSTEGPFFQRFINNLRLTTAR